MKFIIKFGIFLVIIVFGIFFLNYNNFKNDNIIKNDININIEPGDYFNTLGNKIEEFDNIFYKIYIKNNPPSFELREGNYVIKSESNIEEALKSLNKPIYIEKDITILEGWNIFDIDEMLFIKGLINKGDYISYVTNKEKIKELGKFYDFIDKQETLEGFLYPDTYKINLADFAINKLVIKQLDNFEEKVYNKILKGYDTETITDVVNLASIVEKEERNVSEKSTVAGILKKRLNSGWMIGADITVCYPFKLTSEECKMSVTKYLYEVNDYNTRQKTGLPKTPINNPSYESIYATVNDKDTNYWFYLHDTSNGKVYYAETNSEHEYNKSLYIR